MNERLKLILVLVVTAAVTGPLSCCVGWSLARIYPGKESPSQVQVDAKSEGGNKPKIEKKSGGSKADLISLGMPTEEVRSLLGPPDSILFGGAGGGDGNDVWSYNSYSPKLHVSLRKGRVALIQRID
jgi:hypothetical protein